MQRELELKVELSKSDVERLGGELLVGDLSVGPAETKKLRTVYFDTPKHDLHAAGVSLRLRCQNGGWLQTVKADQHVVDGVSNPVELEAPVAGEEPDLAKIADKKIKRVIQKAVQGTTLHPVFETIVRRTTRTIKAQGSEIELAVDDGAVRAGQATRELREVELELKAGSAAGLLLAAEKLLGDHELKLSTRSKAERGYRLALGKRGANAEPEKARPARITCKNSCAEAFSAILESATRQILVNRQAVLETDDPDGAHQLRIGLRRLRSALRALRPLVDRGCLRAFERSARDQGRSVGMLRDADVMISGVMAPMEAVASELGQNLKRLDAEQRHEMRKALKNLRYQTEFFAPLFERRDTRRFIEQLKTLQDVFGYINDVRMAPRLVEVQKQRNGGIDGARAAAYAIGRHEAEAVHVWREAPKAWKDLERSPRFWA
jgi:inorganic triphosphatase YgiF